MSSSDFRDKVRQLEAELTKAQNSINSESCISGTTILVTVSPIVIALALYLIRPWFVEEKDGDKSERSLKKTVMWTVILTLVTWGCIYGYSVYTNGAASTLICKK